MPGEHEASPDGGPSGSDGAETGRARTVSLDELFGDAAVTDRTVDASSGDDTGPAVAVRLVDPTADPAGDLTADPAADPNGGRATDPTAGPAADPIADPVGPGPGRPAGADEAGRVVSFEELSEDGETGAAGVDAPRIATFDDEPGRRSGTRGARRSRADGSGGGGSRSDSSGGSDSRIDGSGARRRRNGGSGDESASGGVETPAEQEARAKEICLRLLTDRARSVKELGDALRRKEIADEVAHRVLERFDEVGLVDDKAFADQWVRSRHRHRGLGKRAIALELHRKGIDRDVADEALTEIDDDSERDRARELVVRRLRSLPVGTREQRQSTARKLVGMLARKGYGGGVAYGVVKEEIAAAGADADELGETPPDD
ncbi:MULTISPECIES: regulatory protein RecX [Pseudonocardia]|uniref:Regulatory protein RecX n=2 Tax=Pseudonocardia TaxID=1847 RepID=A0A1Y2N361_PSEAH|nr:regulatory protein RecX [Pseudonocardia saturnea]OSY41338.1 Regulatory protein RecX [Pseudonocardia autotrophica]TDN76794.1 regulatory protein [Pseudonocardia autotrophica]BBG00795.1 hypothetical protein Pdca_20040 [Pseudonocardia autotrophica]GEC24239.1 hypothetical protein PSA01_12680 [Pseudonocardia saturnea]